MISVKLDQLRQIIFMLEAKVSRLQAKLFQLFNLLSRECNYFVFSGWHEISNDTFEHDIPTEFLGASVANVSRTGRRDETLSSENLPHTHRQAS